MANITALPKEETFAYLSSDDDQRDQRPYGVTDIEWAGYQRIAQSEPCKHCGGTCRLGTYHDMDDEGWQHFMAVCLTCDFAEEL